MVQRQVHVHGKLSSETVMYRHMPACTNRATMETSQGLWQAGTLRQYGFESRDSCYREPERRT